MMLMIKSWNLSGLAFWRKWTFQLKHNPFSKSHLVLRCVRLLMWCADNLSLEFVPLQVLSLAMMHWLHNLSHSASSNCFLVFFFFILTPQIKVARYKSYLLPVLCIDDWVQCRCIFGLVFQQQPRLSLRRRTGQGLCRPSCYRQNTGSRDFFGESSKVGFFVWFCCDCPDRMTVAIFWTFPSIRESLISHPVFIP